MVRNEETRILEDMILHAMHNPTAPLMSVYTVCRRLGIPQGRSTTNAYQRIYRAMERLVEDGKLQVARGTRDPSVYIAMSNITLLKEIPF